MIVLPDPSKIELSLSKQSEDYAAPKGMSGLNEEKVKLLKVDLLTYSESAKKIALRLEQCRSNVANCIQGQSKEIIQKQILLLSTQLNHFINNIGYYSDALGKVVTAYQNNDSGLSDTIHKDAEIIGIEVEVD